MIALYGHPFSSYTWKAQIAFYASGVEYEFRMLEPGATDAAAARVAAASPAGKFPLLVADDPEREVFEATAIVEWLAATHPEARSLIPADPAAAVETRMLDRVFDLYVQHPFQEIIWAHIHSPDAPDPLVLARMRAMLERSYAWLDRWLADYRAAHPVTLIECAAAPALFYADWTHQIPMKHDRLRQWRARLLALPAVARCIEAARPYRHLFPLGAPDRD